MAHYSQFKPSVPSPPQRPGLYAQQIPPSHGSGHSRPSIPVPQQSNQSTQSFPPPQPGQQLPSTTSPPIGKSQTYQYNTWEHGSPHLVQSTQSSYIQSPQSNSEYKPEFQHSYANAAPEDSAYQTMEIQEYDPRPSRGRRFKSKLCLVISFLAGFLWLVPAGYLIYINVTGKIIGASAWCPGGTCSVISYYNDQNDTTAARSARADEKNHDLLGALQLASKAMEVWFVAIAGSMVFSLSRILASRPGGLPLGYLLTHLEITDPRALLNSYLYTGPSGRRQTIQGENKKHAIHLYSFGALAVAMCIISNLMGPSVAVMLLPTLDWVMTPKVEIGRFGSMLSAKSPSMGFNDTIPGCTSAQLSNSYFNCTFIPYVDTMDALVESSMAWSAFNASGPFESSMIYTPSIENIFPFTFNYTASNDPTKPTKIWAPNRQVIRGIASDFDKLTGVVMGTRPDPQYNDYNSSTSLQLQRRGPVMGVEMFMSMGYKSVTVVDDERSINCFGSYLYDGEEYWTKCFQTGRGWNSATWSNGNFDIGSSVADETDLNEYVTSTFYWSDKSTYFKSADSPACFANGTIPSGTNCDWDALFSVPTPSNITEMPRTGLVQEWTAPNMTNHSSTLVAELFPSAGVATYMVDVTEIFPTLKPVQIPWAPTPDTVQNLVLNANWVLAGWSLNNGGGMPSRRPAALEARMAVNSLCILWDMLQGPPEDIASDFQEQLVSATEKASNVAVTTMLQVLSMITYDVSDETGLDEKQHPILTTQIRRQVWKWGLNSRTSHMGISILVIGSLAVITRSVLLLMAKRRNPSTVEMIRHTLEHQPKQEFVGIKSEEQAAKVRFRMHHRDSDGKLKFTKQ